MLVSLALSAIDISAKWLPYVATAIAALTFLASQREIGRRAKVDYVNELEERIKDCEADRADLRRQVRQYRAENLELQRRVLRLEEAP